LKHWHCFFYEDHLIPDGPFHPFQAWIILCSAVFTITAYIIATTTSTQNINWSRNSNTDTPLPNKLFLRITLLQEIDIKFVIHNMQVSTSKAKAHIPIANGPVIQAITHIINTAM
jgi:hypothetical protein